MLGPACRLLSAAGRGGARDAVARVVAAGAAAVAAARARSRSTGGYARPPSVREVLHRMQHDPEGMGAPAAAYMMGMKLESDGKRYRHVLAIHEMMLDAGVAPSRGAYHIYMHAAAELGDLAAVKATLQDMRAYDMRIGITALNILLKAMLKCGDPALEAFRRDLLYSRLKQHPNKYTWPLLISACSTLRDVDDTLRVIRDMKYVLPQRVVAAAVLDVCARDVRWGEVRAEQEVARLVESGARMGITVYTAWARVYYALGQYGKVHAVWQHALEARVSRTPNFVLLQLDALLGRVASVQNPRSSEHVVHDAATGAEPEWGAPPDEPGPKGYNTEMWVCPATQRRVTTEELLFGTDAGRMRGGGDDAEESLASLMAVCAGVLSRSRGDLIQWSLANQTAVWLRALRVYEAADGARGARELLDYARAMGHVSKALRYAVEEVATRPAEGGCGRGDPSDSVFFIPPEVEG